MADTLTPLLLDAKKEYTLRLSEVMGPFVVQFVDATYRAARKEVGDRKALMEFQDKLRAVPSWNASIISQYTRDIENKYSYFSDLVAAVFVTYVKVLSSIKISSQRPSVKLKLPSNETFVHQVYVYTAKNFYENPHAVRDSQQVKGGLIFNAIEMAVRNMLPLGDVLQAYLSSAVNDDNTMNPVMSPAQSDDEDGEAQDARATVPDSDSESDFDEGEEKIIPSMAGGHESTDANPATISPANHPFPTDPVPMHIPQPMMQPAPQPPISQPLAAAAPGSMYRYPAGPPPTPVDRPNLFADAHDGEHQFR
jgi:hypothetical protein